LEDTRGQTQNQNRETGGTEKKETPEAGFFGKSKGGHQKKKKGDISECTIHQKNRVRQGMKKKTP